MLGTGALPRHMITRRALSVVSQTRLLQEKEDTTHQLPQTPPAPEMKQSAPNNDTRPAHVLLQPISFLYTYTYAAALHIGALTSNTPRDLSHARPDALSASLIIVARERQEEWHTFRAVP